MSAPVDRRWAVMTAVCGTVFIAAGAFWLSYTALADLAVRSGIGADQAWAWPLIVDGLIVVGTVAVVARAGQPGAWYPWLLLVGGAVVSVGANAIHAVVAADADVPPLLAATVAAVPPVVLLAITHLTVVLTRSSRVVPNGGASGGGLPHLVVEASAPPATESPAAQPNALSGMPVTSTDDQSVDGHERREIAHGLREQGWSNKTIARHLGVHPSTVGRWFAPTQQGEDATSAAEEAAP